MTPFEVHNLVQQFFVWWLISWHGVIVSTNVGLPSTGHSNVNYRVMFTWKLKISIPRTCLKLARLNSHSRVVKFKQGLYIAGVDIGVLGEPTVNSTNYAGPRITPLDLHHFQAEVIKRYSHWGHSPKKQWVYTYRVKRHFIYIKYALRWELSLLEAKLPIYYACPRGLTSGLSKLLEQPEQQALKTGLHEHSWNYIYY